MEGNYRKNPTPPSIWSSRLRPFSQSYGINRKHFHFSSSTLLAASTICLQPLLHTAWYCRQFSTLATLYCSKLSPLNLLTVIVAPETFCAVQFVRRDFSSLLFSKVIQAPRWVCQIQSPDQKYYSEDSTIKKMLTFFIWRKGIFVGHLCWLASWRYWKTFIGTWSDRKCCLLSGHGLPIILYIYHVSVGFSLMIDLLLIDLRWCCFSGGFGGRFHGEQVSYVHCGSRGTFGRWQRRLFFWCQLLFLSFVCKILSCASSPAFSLKSCLISPCSLAQRAKSFTAVALLRNCRVEVSWFVTISICIETEEIDSFHWS